MPETLEEFVSPSGKYKLTTVIYSTTPDTLHFCLGKVYSLKDGSLLFEVHRNHESFPYCFVEGHPNGHDYLICGEDYQGQTILELDTSKRIDYLPEGEKNGVGFCWSEYAPSKEKDVLAVLGCFWACTNDLRIVDFSEPMNLPFQVFSVIHEVRDINHLKSGWSWREGMTITGAKNYDDPQIQMDWEMPKPQEVLEYWKSQLEKEKPDSPFVVDIKKQIELATLK